MPDFPEILSIKAMLQNALLKVEEIESKMTKQPSKRVSDKQARMDRLMVKKLTIIERSKRKVS